MSEDKKPSNPRVFPHTEFGGVEHYGMTLRDWLAGQALVALADWDSPKEAARHAYKLADEMLKARQP